MHTASYSLSKATWPNAFDAAFVSPSTHRHCPIPWVVVEVLKNGWHQAFDGRLTFTRPNNGIAKDCLATARNSNGFSQPHHIGAAFQSQQPSPFESSDGHFW
jgi:hypothetical protein